MVVLPITLLEFAAVSTVETVELNWTTGSEINNAYFLLERSDGGHYVEELGVVSGQGSSHYNTDYQFVDEHPDRSLPYYRLTQVDYNGRSTSFDWVRVEDVVSDPRSIVLHGNPQCGSVIKGVIGTPEFGKPIRLELLNGFGEILTTTMISSSGNPTTSFEIQVPQQTGWYYLRSAGELPYTEPVLVLR